MADVATESKKTKDRSPSFPYITLERALERVRSFYNEEKRGVAPYTRAVLHWGFTPSSSSALQTVSALKSYGLLAETGGSGMGRNLQLSQLALRILLDQRPDSQERDAYIRDAARSPTVAAEVYAKWPKLPSDSTLSHYLVLERRFNESTAPGVIKILKENQAFAKLEAVDVLSDAEQIDQEEAMDPAPHITQGSSPAAVRAITATQAVPAVAQLARSVATPAFDAGHTEQHVLRSGMKVTVHFSEQPTGAAYHALARLMKFKGDDFEEQEAPPSLPQTGAA